MDEMISFDMLLWSIDTRSEADALAENFPGLELEVCELLAGNTDPDLLERLIERNEEILTRWSNGGQEPYAYEVDEEMITYDF